MLDSPLQIHPSPRESKLQTIFGDSDEDEESSASQTARKNVIFNLKPASKDEAPRGGLLRVPETLGLEYLEEFVPEPPCKQVSAPKPPQVLSNQKGFTIKETIDPRGEDFGDYGDLNPVVFPRTTSRPESLTSKKVSSNESIVSCTSSYSSKTPKKSSTSTPRKHNAVTPSKQVAAIANSNKKIDQFFKKKPESPNKNSAKVQVRSITADLNAVRKTTVSQEQAKSSMVTRSGHAKTPEKVNRAHQDSEHDEAYEFEETFVDEAHLELLKKSGQKVTSVDFNIKEESVVVLVSQLVSSTNLPF